MTRRYLIKSKKTDLISQSTIRTWVSREAVVKTGETEPESDLGSTASYRIMDMKTHMLTNYTNCDVHDTIMAV